MTSLYLNTPAELRTLKQWTLWKYEPNGGKKPDKVPYQPNGRKASISEPDTWSSFNEVIEHVHKYDGIYFAITEGDPYGVVDLDDASEVPDEAKRKESLESQTKIYNALISYSERSPSGKGCHVWIKVSDKSKVIAARKRNKVEWYAHSRFMSVTGDVCRDRNIPIAELQELAEILHKEMEGKKQQPNYVNEINEKFTDEEIMQWALNADNGEKFHNLWEGHWQDITDENGNQRYPSQSEADFALIDIIANYTRARNQVWRLFLKSELGKQLVKRKKAHSAYLIERMLNRLTTISRLRSYSKIYLILMNIFAIGGKNDFLQQPDTAISKSTLV
jgi:primase-polymerase (primpol)-like protein